MGHSVVPLENASGMQRRRRGIIRHQIWKSEARMGCKWGRPKQASHSTAFTMHCVGPEDNSMFWYAQMMHRLLGQKVNNNNNPCSMVFTHNPSFVDKYIRTHCSNVASLKMQIGTREMHIKRDFWPFTVKVHEWRRGIRPEPNFSQISTKERLMPWTCRAGESVKFNRASFFGCAHLGMQLQCGACCTRRYHRIDACLDPWCLD